jgi:hypothetical protein
MALRVALDLDVYNTLSSDDGSPKSAAQLAEPKGADPVLVGGCWFLIHTSPSNHAMGSED